MLAPMGHPVTDAYLGQAFLRSYFLPFQLCVRRKKSGGFGQTWFSVIDIIFKITHQILTSLGSNVTM